MTTLRRSVLTMIAAAALLTGCAVAAPAAGPSGAPRSPAAVERAPQHSPSAAAAQRTRSAAGTEQFPANGRFDYQLGGPYQPRDPVRIVTRDRLQQPVRGRYSICYLNAFQTQPESGRYWREHRRDLLLKRDGRLITDPDWPGEYILDTSTAAKRERIARIVGSWISDCAEDGYQAVEPDNLDTYTRYRDLLTESDNAALARLLVRRAHRSGLAIAQKNTPELGSRGAEQIGFDFAVAEECQAYRECGSYTRWYGNRVLEIEYTDQRRAEAVYAEACRIRGHRIPVILRDRDVLPRGANRYRYRWC